MNDREIHLGPIPQALPDAFLLLESSGRILDANPGALKLFRRSREDLLGATLTELVATPADALLDYLRSVSSSSHPTPGAVAIAGPDGPVAYRCDGGRIQETAGGRAAVAFLRLRPRAAAATSFGLLSDKVKELGRQVVARMRTEALLEGQREVLELIASGAPLDETLEALVHVVEAHAGGGMRASILLLHERSHLHHGAAPSLPDGYRRAIDGLKIGPDVGSCGSAAHLNETVIVEDVMCDTRWSSFRALAEQYGFRACWSSPIPARTGEVLGTFAMYYDRPRTPGPQEERLVALISRTAAVAIERSRESHQIQSLLASERLARSEAEAANNAKDEFLALISHELRNPLNAIVGWAKVLSEGCADEETLRTGIDAIDRNAGLQARLITEMLDFSRIASGKLQLDPRPTDLRELIRETVASVRPQAEHHRLVLDYENSLDAESLVLDPQRIRQVLDNLLSNAIKFSNEGGRIDIILDSQDGEARIRVRDRGCGINPDFLPMVFDRFRQGDSTRSRRHEGLGLGLAIARHIVTLHEGQIQVASDGPGLGTTFTVHLPMRRAAPAAGNAKKSRRADLCGLRVLVVDDALDARNLLENVLRGAGASVTLAASGPEALACRQESDILLCDIAMPEMDGYDVIREWRALEAGNRRVPAIALTAYARESDRRTALDAGFDEHLTKPIDPATLPAVVRKIFTRLNRGR